MKTKPSYVPPDPGGRSRYLMWFLCALIVACVVVVVIYMTALRDAAPPVTPPQQKTNASFLCSGPIHA